MDDCFGKNKAKLQNYKMSTYKQNKRLNKLFKRMGLKNEIKEDQILMKGRSLYIFSVESKFRRVIY
jgi:hypothetical protein